MPRTIVDHWKNPKAKLKAKQLMHRFGKPKYASRNRLEWRNKGGYSRLFIIDEQIPHNFPVPHHDFVYSTRKMKVPANRLDDFGRVTGSIMYDGLKKEVTARCGHLVKNSVTLGYVNDVIKGKINPTKSEYSRRILGNITPKWHRTGKKL